MNKDTDTTESEMGQTEHNSVINEYSPCSIFCKPCKEFKRDNYEATKFCTQCQEHLCNRCSNIHCEPKPSRDHKLIDIDEARKLDVKQCDKDTKYSERCSKHANHVADFYCWNHEVVRCNVCITLEHRLCGNIVCLEDEGEKIESNPDFKTMQSEMEELQVIVRDMELKVGLAKRKLDEFKLKERERVICFHDQFVNAFDALKNQILHELDDVEDENTTLLDVFCENMEAMKSIFTTFRTTTEDKLTRKEKVSLYITMIRSRAIFHELKTKISELMDSPLSTKYCFEQASKAEEILESLKGIGTIKRAEQVTLNLVIDENQSETDESRKLQIVDELNVQLEGDLETNSLSGLIVLSDNSLAIVDRGNPSIRLVDCAKKSIVSHLTLPGCPWDVTEVSHTTLAVTIPSMSSVRLVKRTSLGLSLDYRIEVIGCCYGIGFINGTFIASCVEDTGDFIVFFTATGKVLKTINTGENGQRLFNAPMYVRHVPQGDTFYVSNTAGNNVICMNMSGDVIACYDGPEFKGASGIAALSDGKLYVKCEDKCVIYEIDPSDVDGPRRLLMEDCCRHLQSPIAITCDEQSMHLYMCSHQCGVVRVLKLNVGSGPTENWF